MKAIVSVFTGLFMTVIAVYLAGGLGTTSGGELTKTSANATKQVVTVRGIAFELVPVPPGEFLMGSEDNPEEKPVHGVRLRKGFAMGKTEVTVRQFRGFVEGTSYVTDAEKQGRAYRVTSRGWELKPGANWREPGLAQSDDCPVVLVSWNDAVAFCRWLSAESGRNFRLPSEAEWEYACRAGTRGRFAGDASRVGWDMGWHLFNASGRSQPVGQKKPNPWGLYDMHGNVWEWCQDEWHDDYTGAPQDGGAWLAGSEQCRVWRGGAWNRPPDYMSSSARGKAPAWYGCPNAGFRVVLESD